MFIFSCINVHSWIYISKQFSGMCSMSVWDCSCLIWMPVRQICPKPVWQAGFFKLNEVDVLTALISGFVWQLWEHSQTVMLADHILSSWNNCCMDIQALHHLAEKPMWMICSNCSFESRIWFPSISGRMASLASLGGHWQRASLLFQACGWISVCTGSCFGLNS